MIREKHQHLARKISMIFSPPNHPIRSLQQHQQEVIHLNLSLVHHRQVRIIIIIRTKQVHPMTDYQDPKSCKMQQNPFLIELSSTKWKNLLCEEINRRILFVLYILLFSFLFRCRPRKKTKSHLTTNIQLMCVFALSIFPRR